MKYSIVQCVNGNFSVKAEYSDLDKARVGYHATCSSLWNASDVITGSVAIVDENLNTVPGYVEHIAHEQA